MEKIIKYDQNLVFADGGFVTKKGNIIILSCDYERFAMEYCLGSDCDMKDSELSKENLEKFKSWLQYYFNKHSTTSNMYSNFLIQVLGFDRIDSDNKKIITASENSNIRFNNYHLNGWKIQVVDKLIYKKDSFVIKDYLATKEVKEKNISFSKSLSKI